MNPIPLPSHIHYELLLQLLERQTMFAASSTPPQQEQIHELIITLRKALSQQKQIEASCQRAGIPVAYRWSLNAVSPPDSVQMSDEGESQDNGDSLEAS